MISYLPKNVVGFLEVHKKNSDVNEVDSDVSETVQIEETSKHLPNKKKKKLSAAVKWEKKQCLKEILEANITDLANSHPQLVVLKPVALFRLLFNIEICSLIATATERYASQQNELFHLEQHEIDTFIGIILLTGYNGRPRQRLYWSKNEDVVNPLVSR